MLKGAAVIAAGVLVIAVLAIASSGSAIAATPKCKSKSNQYVACTDRLRSAPPRTRRLQPKPVIPVHPHIIQRSSS
jgi:hypothetical protein